MGKKGNRTVAQIEKAFKVIHERDNVNEVSIRQVKGWLDDNTRDGMNIMRLANFYPSAPDSKWSVERKRGTTETRIVLDHA